ncbi:hypothetical protein CITRIK5_30415 [Citricoccus sp. K5]|nr:hypothetical protein CITRIK5_30415 [Citricoccus sp. K5]
MSAHGEIPVSLDSRIGFYASSILRALQEYPLAVASPASDPPEMAPVSGFYGLVDAVEL